MEEKLRRYVDGKFWFYPKTPEIYELREELYSMMRDKFRDCQNSGMSKEESYKQALTFMEDYKLAIREVETGSSLGALRKKTLDFLGFSAFYFIALVCGFLYLSMVSLKSFDDTWLIIVGGAFVYLVYLAANVLGYVKMFRLHVLRRWALGFLFLSLVPLLYVLPSLLAGELLGHPIWEFSWLLIPVLLFAYIATDFIAFGRTTAPKCRGFELVLGGLVLTTAVYLTVSYFYSLWSIAWLVYLVYLSIVACLLPGWRVRARKA